MSRERVLPLIKPTKYQEWEHRNDWKIWLAKLVLAGATFYGIYQLIPK